MHGCGVELPIQRSTRKGSSEGRLGRGEREDDSMHDGNKRRSTS